MDDNLLGGFLKRLKQMRPVMNDNPLSGFLKRLRQNGVASRFDLVGCSREEIDVLERKYMVRLPKMYRHYLEVMGHESGKLFTHDHLAVFYPYILRMTQEERERWADEPPDKRIVLPQNALVIAGRLGAQFEFIRCEQEDDSPVWYYNENDCEIKKVHDSILDWLNSFCSEAERAISSGYFNQYPGGTSP